MLTGLVYFLVIFISVTIGAVSGLSGGIIIKPLLVFLNDYDIVTITILSSVAVFAMSSTNLLTRLKAKEKVFSIELLSLIIGSMVGGYIGNLLFESFIVNFDKGLVSIFQTLVLIILLIFLRKKPN